jgi:hypothetical protein
LSLEEDRLVRGEEGERDRLLSAARQRDVRGDPGSGTTRGDVAGRRACPPRSPAGEDDRRLAGVDLDLLARCNYRLAWSILLNDVDAADATQDAFVAAWRQLPRLRD